MGVRVGQSPRSGKPFRENHPQYTRPGSNHNLLVIAVYGKSDALDHATTEALESASVLPTHRNWEDDFDKTITKAQAEVDKIKAWIDDQSQQLQTKATASVQDVFKDFDDALKQAQDKGATMGIDVSSCVDGKQETVDSEVQELVQAAFACATNELNSAVDLASNLLDQIETIKNKVVEIAADFEDCNHKNKLKKAECIAKETAKAVEQAAKVEIDVSGFISKETLLFEELAPKLLACEAVQLNAAEQEAKQLESDLEACIINRSDFGETGRDQDNSRTQTIHKRRQPKYLKVFVTGVM
uniref:Uncharacterized protein n=1 Tax=Timema shepardi TaxID=629360 RepID=A0A7R9G4H8_TIMSH|nr:unnamed protein product [Timema shepardi]